MRDTDDKQIPACSPSLLSPRLVEQIRELAARCDGPFYVYDQAAIEQNCRDFLAIPYADKSIHFASMANSTRRFLEIVRGAGLQIFVNSPGHLALAREIGFAGQQIVYTSSAMDDGLLRLAHDAGAIVNLDSMGQLAAWRRLFGDEPVGIRCNIGELVEPRPTLAGYFLGKQSRLGLTVDEIESLAGQHGIAGLHVYVGTDILDLGYFRDCYQQLARLTKLFPALRFVDFGGGFGLPHNSDAPFPIEQYRDLVTELMTRLSNELGRSIRLLLEPGRIIGGAAGFFVCRVTDVKLRGDWQLIGLDASSTQFPRPLFYPADARHPVTLLDAADRSVTLRSSLYGCSTYSRDFLARDLQLPATRIGDLVVLGQAGSYCATAFTHFLGFEPATEFFV
ncbi:MAG: hypothetical protein JXR83_09960 [Deltaproteobacteria bacterium]|nr:hypothetical protein [Deltaproteobacteria bacterium]